MALRNFRKKADVLHLDDDTDNHTYTISLKKKNAGTKIKISTKKKIKSRKFTRKSKAGTVKENNDDKVIKKNDAKEVRGTGSYVVIQSSEYDMTAEAQDDVNAMNQSQMRLVKVTNKNLQGKPSFIILEDADAKRRLTEKAKDDISIRSEKQEVTNEKIGNDCKSSTVSSQTDDYLLKSALQEKIICSTSAMNVVKSNAEQEKFLQTHLKFGELRALKLRAERSRKISHVHNLANLSHIIPQGFVSSKPVSLRTSLYSAPSRRRPNIPLQNSLYSSSRLTRRQPLNSKRKPTCSLQPVEGSTVQSDVKNLSDTQNPNDTGKKANGPLKSLSKIERQQSVASKNSNEPKSSLRKLQGHLPTDEVNNTNCSPQSPAMQHLTKPKQQKSDAPVIVGVGAPHVRTGNEGLPKIMRQENFIVEPSQQQAQLTTPTMQPCIFHTSQSLKPNECVSMRPTYIVLPQQISDQNRNQQQQIINNLHQKNSIQMVKSQMWLPSCSTANPQLGCTSFVNSSPNNTNNMQAVWSRNIQQFEPFGTSQQIIQLSSQQDIQYNQSSAINLGSQYQHLSGGGIGMSNNCNELYREPEGIPPIRSDIQNYPVYYNHALQNMENLGTQRTPPQMSQLNTSSSQYCYGNQQRASAYHAYHRPQQTAPPSNRIYNGKQNYFCGNAMRSKNCHCACGHRGAASNNGNSTALPDTLPGQISYIQHANLGGPVMSSSMVGSGSNHHYYAGNRLCSGGGGPYSPNFYYPSPNNIQFRNQTHQYSENESMRQVEMVPMYPSFISMHCQEFHDDNTARTAAMSKESELKISDLLDTSQNQDKGDNRNQIQVEYNAMPTQFQVKGKTLQKLFQKEPPRSAPQKLYKGVLRFPTHYGVRFQKNRLVLRAQPFPLRILGKQTRRPNSISP